MILANILNAIIIAFGFSVVGLLLNFPIRNMAFYNKLSRFNFVKGKKVNKNIGVLYFRQMLITSFWRHFNPKIKVTEKPTHEELLNLRKEIIYAEISHLIAFVGVLVFAGITYSSKHYSFIIALLISNILFHFYPALVQQYNKRRLDIVLTRIKK